MPFLTGVDGSNFVSNYSYIFALFTLHNTIFLDSLRPRPRPLQLTHLPRFLLYGVLLTLAVANGHGLPSYSPFRHANCSS